MLAKPKLRYKMLYIILARWQSMRGKERQQKVKIFTNDKEWE
jgi:hypothetical protein